MSEENAEHDGARDIAEGARNPPGTDEETIAEQRTLLVQQFDNDLTLEAYLQLTPPKYMARARCSAACCNFAKEARSSHVEIKDDYRIMLGVRERKFFHVTCFEHNIDPSSLLPARLKLDAASYRWNDNWPWTWGLIIRKWFDCKGYIDLNQIAQYIDDYEKHEEESGEWDTIEISRQLAQQRGDGSVEDAPEIFLLPPTVTPTLESYAMASDLPCALSTVLQHKYVERLAPAIAINSIISGDFSLVFPERGFRDLFPPGSIHH
ncbi:hypothetical protein EJ05DRAFT_505660 [Pseudovirgaria hyperparasitica]|uniref:Uncharacterized protein n=1 Tax=Pseudovirgaria hyperparasitica TaxID=470096 RepID=A0A6A6VRQ0_9PEZI|nr:uncharacterized protein EJ05DRAFT_505660 [Pseudovirgaria hyperparasitica]KAF2752835.1 hypothetical protein EJ05DRAFT_505660 [Pseudovirgaria hyperparasitica]